MKQGSSASLSFDAKKKPTRREKFLGEMDKVVPWEALLALIELSYPTSGRRGPAVRLERNVRDCSSAQLFSAPRMMRFGA
jgi:hypothetical protein